MITIFILFGAFEVEPGRVSVHIPQVFNHEDDCHEILERVQAEHPNGQFQCRKYVGRNK